MRNRFDNQLAEMNDELISMGALCENAIASAVKALLEGDIKLAAAAIRIDQEIDRKEREIESMCLKLLLQQQPVASDLRLISSVLKMITDIERIGDHAENVADAARQRKEEGVSISKEAQKELGDMLEMVNKIIRYAVEMFAKSDESHMQEIVTLEDQVDEKERELQKKHVERLTKGECSPEAGMIFSDIVSGLERVADHATNIAFAITTEEDAEDGDIKR